MIDIGTNWSWEENKTWNVIERKMSQVQLLHLWRQNLIMFGLPYRRQHLCWVGHRWHCFFVAQKFFRFLLPSQMSSHRSLLLPASQPGWSGHVILGGIWFCALCFEHYDNWIYVWQPDLSHTESSLEVPNKLGILELFQKFTTLFQCLHLTLNNNHWLLDIFRTMTQSILCLLTSEGPE